MEPPAIINVSDTPATTPTASAEEEIHRPVLDIPRNEELTITAVEAPTNVAATLPQIKVAMLKLALRSHPLPKFTTRIPSLRPQDLSDVC